MVCSLLLQDCLLSLQPPPQGLSRPPVGMVTLSALLLHKISNNTAIMPDPMCRLVAARMVISDLTSLMHSDQLQVHPNAHIVHLIGPALGLLPVRQSIAATCHCLTHSTSTNLRMTVERAYSGPGPLAKPPLSHRDRVKTLDLFAYNRQRRGTFS